jgi:hypothetical protein
MSSIRNFIRLVTINNTSYSFVCYFVCACWDRYYTAGYLSLSSRTNPLESLTNSADHSPKLSQLAGPLITFLSNTQISNIYKKEHNV